MLLILGITLLCVASAVIGWLVGKENGWFDGYREAVADKERGIL